MSVSQDDILFLNTLKEHNYKNTENTTFVEGETTLKGQNANGHSESSISLKQAVKGLKIQQAAQGL